MPAQSLTQRITLVADGRRYDLAVPAHARVADLLSTLGIGSSASPFGIATASGKVFGANSTLDDAVTDGAVLTVVRMTSHELPRGVVSLERGASGAGRRGRRSRDAGGAGARASEQPTPSTDVDDATRRRADLALPGTGPAPTTRQPTPARGGNDLPVALSAGLVAIAAALAAAVAGLALRGLPVRDPATATQGTVAGAVLVATAALLALQTRSDSGGRAGRLVAPIVGFAGGLLLPTPDTPRAALVALLSGAVIGAALAAVSRTGAARRDGPALVAMLVLSVIAGLTLVAILLRWPASAIAALLAGLGPLLVRMLPSMGLDVPDEQLVDSERLATTVWVGRASGRRRRLRSDEVADHFRRARDIVAAGVLWAAVLTPIALGFVLWGEAPVGVARWSGLALAVVAALAYGYQSRGFRDRLPRFALLASTGVIVLMATYAAVTALVGRPFLLVGLALVLGSLAVWGSDRLAVGWRSPRLSGLADRVEGMAVTLSLPLAIAAAGGIEFIGQLATR
ncbi:MAG: EsaB/YukD family protein [Micrococcales bacterium]|nr:EsaB/YukD family protein [Micrococcales bacterium]